MSHSNRAIIARNIPLRLSKAQMSCPEDVLTRFFDAYDLEDTRNALWLMVSNAICLEDDDFSDQMTRATVLMYYEEFETLIEAAFLICSQPNSYKGKKNKSKP